MKSSGISSIAILLCSHVYGFGTPEIMNNNEIIIHMHKLNSLTKLSGAAHDENINNDQGRVDAQGNRRKLFKKSISAAMSIFAMSAFADTSQGACLAGDISIDCIGFYKVPIDDAINSMVNTPEQLAKYAPDLRWVPPVEYPKNYQVAKDEIFSLRSSIQGLTTTVSKGDLTAAGVEILRVVPRITVAGRVLIGTLKGKSEFSMRAFRSEVAHNELLASLSGVDILLGQSIAGQLGSITAAQIQILEELRSVNQNYEEFLRALPENFSG